MFASLYFPRTPYLVSGIKTTVLSPANWSCTSVSMKPVSDVIRAMQATSSLTVHSCIAIWIASSFGSEDSSSERSTGSNMTSGSCMNRHLLFSTLRGAAKRVVSTLWRSAFRVVTINQQLSPSRCCKHHIPRLESAKALPALRKRPCNQNRPEDLGRKKTVVAIKGALVNQCYWGGKEGNEPNWKKKPKNKMKPIVIIPAYIESDWMKGTVVRPSEHCLRQGRSRSLSYSQGLRELLLTSTFSTCILRYVDCAPLKTHDRSAAECSRIFVLRFATTFCQELLESVSVAKNWGTLNVQS